MDGMVVIGEGEKDEAPMLYNGEQIGDGSPPVVDIAVDPLEGTRLCALGMPSDARPPPPRGGDGRGARGGRPHPPDHRGDVSAALLAVSDRSPVDLLWGIGGTPEGVLSAAALKSMGGQMLGRLWPRDEAERSAALEAGYDLDRVLTADDLCAAEDVFFSASGVTDGDVLEGVRYRGPGASTESLVMRSRCGTVRRIQARHDRASQWPVAGPATLSFPFSRSRSTSWFCAPWPDVRCG